MVFNKELKDKYIVFQQDETLMMSIKSKHKLDKTENLLQHFTECNIKYFIHQTKHHFIVIIYIMDNIAEEWAEFQELEVEINPSNAIKRGRESPGFHLAQNTFAPILDQSNHFSLHGIDEKFTKLNINKWKHIHIPFESTLQSDIYLQPILNDRIYLGLLYDALTADKEVGGAQFNVERKLNQSNHPLAHCFALHAYASKNDKR